MFGVFKFYILRFTLLSILVDASSSALPHVRPVVCVIPVPKLLAGKKTMMKE